MAFQTEIARGIQVAPYLYHAFRITGIHGNKEMPEDLTPSGVVRGSLEHILFITLSVCIDYQRDANALWASSRQTYEDPETRYLFNPQMLHETPFSKIVRDMQKYKLSKKPQQDANAWHTVGVSFYKKSLGDPRNFFDNCNWDAPLILAKLKIDGHHINGKRVPDYPFLRGDKIGPLWLRMLRDNVGLTHIRNLDKVTIPVDIHVALGVVRGQYKGRLDNLFEIIRQVWFESIKGLTVDGRQMIALDVDEPLWHLSKYGCTYRDKITGTCPVYDRCEAKEFCIKGKVSIQNNLVELDT
jgi:hypothetical protein